MENENIKIVESNGLTKIQFEGKEFPIAKVRIFKGTDKERVINAVSSEFNDIVEEAIENDWYHIVRSADKYYDAFLPDTFFEENRLDGSIIEDGEAVADLESVFR